jgi:hypothetical protein
LKRNNLLKITPHNSFFLFLHLFSCSCIRLFL